MTTTLRRVLLAATAVTAVGAAVLAPAAMATEDTDHEKDKNYGADDGKDKGDKGDKGGDKGGLTAVGLAGDKLVRFDTANPGKTGELGTISGLDEGDEALVGIDFRVQDGLLYGVGTGGGLYTLDDEAVATKVGQLSVELDGEFFGVDFNPAANALRVVSDTGQNLRQPFAALPTLAPTVEDTDLTNPAVAPATGTVPAEGVSAAGYTNNDLDAGTATTLFDLDTALDRVALQSPANAGTLAPTGSLPADIGPDAGLDVYSTLTDGKATANDAFATVEVDGEKRLWVIDLLTGGAEDKGTFDAEVTDLAVALDD